MLASSLKRFNFKGSGIGKILENVQKQGVFFVATERMQSLESDNTKPEVSYSTSAE